MNKICIALWLIFFGLVLLASPLGGQQKLDVSSDDTRAGEPVTVTGVVTESRKYSFQIDTSTEKLEVQVPNGLDLLMKLHKPFFNPVAKTLRVQSDGQEGKEYQIVVPFFAPAFIRVEFNHENHKKRILSKTPWRLNNYVVARQPWKPESTDKLLVGQLTYRDGEKKYRLKMADGTEHEIILGHQNARIDGYSILDLKPQKTRVEVKGQRIEDNVQAESILFWPVK